MQKKAIEEPLLSVRNLEVTYYTRAGEVRAVDDVSLDIFKGEVVGLVGESGCGKSTLGMALLRLVRSPGQITDGQILFHGNDILKISEEEMRRLRGAHISMIFQDPMTSLDPLQRIDDHFVESIQAHDKSVSREEAVERAAELFDLLGIARDRLHDYPHQLSGGMRQRVMIGLALALNAELIVADEPTTSLDVLVEAQFLDLLKDLRHRYNMTLILITHNIGIVAELADRVAVMYAGKLVELADVMPLFEKPLHPYTEALLSSVPNINLDTELKIMEGQPPDLLHPPTGCRFHPRCPYAKEICSQKEPPLVEIEPGRWVACWLYAEQQTSQETKEGAYA
jgi:peptide/nickel transport system ATP-binding protein